MNSHCAPRRGRLSVRGLDSSAPSLPIAASGPARHLATVRPSVLTDNQVQVLARRHQRPLRDSPDAAPRPEGGAAARPARGPAAAGRREVYTVVGTDLHGLGLINGVQSFGPSYPVRVDGHREGTAGAAPDSRLPRGLDVTSP